MPEFTMNNFSKWGLDVNEQKDTRLLKNIFGTLICSEVESYPSLLTLCRKSLGDNFKLQDITVYNFSKRQFESIWTLYTDEYLKAIEEDVIKELLVSNR